MRPRVPTSPPACSRPSSRRWWPRRCARSSRPAMTRWWWPAASAPTGCCANAWRAAVARQGARVFYPRIEFCTDNAAMIAVAGMARLKAGLHEGPGDPRAGQLAARGSRPLVSTRKPKLSKTQSHAAAPRPTRCRARRRRPTPAIASSCTGSPWNASSGSSNGNAASSRRS